MRSILDTTDPWLDRVDAEVARLAPQLNVTRQMDFTQSAPMSVYHCAGVEVARVPSWAPGGPRPVHAPVDAEVAVVLTGLRHAQQTAALESRKQSRRLLALLGHKAEVM